MAVCSGPLRRRVIRSAVSPVAREFLKPKVAPTTEVVAGDVLDKRTLKDAMTGLRVAYYLIHSMGGEKNFEEEDRRAARNFGEAAREGGVRRIIYLGPGGPPPAALAPSAEPDPRPACGVGARLSGGGDRSGDAP